MKSYSNDLWKRVIGTYYNAEGSLRKLAVTLFSEFELHVVVSGTFS
jgi:hypothetical protein